MASSEFASINAMMQKMNRNVSTLEDKATLSINDGESMSALSRLERDIVLADSKGISDELQSLTSNDNAAYVMQILERDLESIGINCSWTQNSTLNLRAADVIFRAQPDSSDSPENLKSIIGKALSLTRLKAD